MPKIDPKSAKAGSASGTCFGKRSSILRKLQKGRKKETKKRRKRKPQRKGGEEAPFQGDVRRIYKHPLKAHPKT